MSSTVLTGKGCVVNVSDGLVFGGVQDFKLSCDLEEAVFPAGDSWSSYSVPVGTGWRGEVTFKALDVETLKLALGGQTETGRVLEVLGEAAVVPLEAPFGVELAHDDVVAGSERVRRADGERLRRVADSPAAGEYAVVGASLTFNPAEAGTELRLDYLRLDNAAGDRLVVGPRDLPARFSLYGVLRGHDLRSGEVPAGRFAVYLADCRRSGVFRFGAANGKLGSFSLAFVAGNTNPGDVVFYLPPATGTL